MPQTNLGINININTSQAVGQVQDLSDTIADLNREIRNVASAGDWQSVAQLTQALDSASSGRGQIINQTRQAQAAAAQAAQQGGIFGGDYGDVAKYLLAQSLTKLTETIISALEKGFDAAKQRASGNYTGAAVSERQRDAGLISGGAGLLAGILGLVFSGGNPFVAGLTGQLAEKIVGFFANIPRHKLEESLAYSSQYKSALPGIDTLNQLFGGNINRNTKEENNRGEIDWREEAIKAARDKEENNRGGIDWREEAIKAARDKEENNRSGIDINGKTAEQNNTYGMNMREKAVDAAKGTGLDTERFIEAMGKMAAYGNMSFDGAASLTRNQAMWARFTGADLGTIQKFAGQAYRYARETDATATAYGGLMAQNMGKGQFSEFLNSLERIMSESIAKGFIKSTAEIAGNMQMLYKLSGGSRLWQGEQGAQRLSQMSGSIASAVALETPAHNMVYAAASGLLKKGGPEKREENYKELMGFNSLSDADKKLLAPTGDYTDNMVLLERMGASAKMIGGLKKIVEGFEGNNVAAIVEWYRQFYGLNYSGAKQLYNMTKGKTDAELYDYNFQKEVEDRILSNKDYKSDSAIYKDMINSLGQLGAKIGQFEFLNTELPALRGSMKALEDALLGRAGIAPQRALDQITENLTLPNVPGPGYGVNDSRMMAWRTDMQVIVASANSPNPFASEFAKRVNNELIPSLANMTNVSDEMAGLINQLIRDSRGIGGRGTNRQFDENRAAIANTTLDTLIQVVKQNTEATANNTARNNEEANLHVTFEGF